MSKEEGLPKNLSGVDHIFFLKEKKTPMSIGGMILVDGNVSMETLNMDFEKLIKVSPRLKQKLSACGKLWEDYTEFNLGDHIKEIDNTADVSGNDSLLKRLASEELSTPLPAGKPLWHCHVVRLPKQQSAVLFKIHHGITDGQGGVHMLLSLLETPDGGRPLQANASSSSSKAAAAAASGSAARPRPVGLEAVRTLVSDWVIVIGFVVMQALLLLHGMLDDLYILALHRKKSLPSMDASETAYVTDWSASVPLADAKAIYRTLGGSLNDVMLTVVTQCTRRYLEEQGGVQDTNLLLSMPVSFRRPGDYSLTNRSFLSTVWLPITEQDSTKCLRTLSMRTRCVKRSHYTRLKYLLTDPWPPAVMGAFLPLFDYFTSKISLLLTNVPGPMNELSLGGCKVVSLLPLVPMIAPGAMTVGVMSYNGGITLCITTCDDRLVAMPARVCELFEEEFTLLKARADEVAASGGAGVAEEKKGEKKKEQ